MRKEEYIRLVNNLTLESIEMNGGHILAKHLDQTDRNLIYRCTKDNKKLATSFLFSKEEVLEMIKDALLDEEYMTPESIIEWLDDDSDGGDFYAVKEYDHVVGKGYFRAAWHAWDKGPAMCHSINVVLRKVERKADTTFKIVTAYPCVTENDVIATKNM